MPIQTLIIVWKNKKGFLRKKHVGVEMHDIIEHYGKVVIALAAILAADLITAGVVTIVKNKTNNSVDNQMNYDNDIRNAYNAN